MQQYQVNTKVTQGVQMNLYSTFTIFRSAILLGAIDFVKLAPDPPENRPRHSICNAEASLLTMHTSKTRRRIAVCGELSSDPSLRKQGGPIIIDGHIPLLHHGFCTVNNTTAVTHPGFEVQHAQALGAVKIVLSRLVPPGKVDFAELDRLACFGGRTDTCAL
jgi:hypothetical protein